MVNVTAKFAEGCTGYLEIVYQLLSSHGTAPDRQCKYDVILRRVRVTVSVFQISTYGLFLFCVWSFSYRKCKAHVPCHNLWHVLLYRVFHFIWYTTCISEEIYWIQNISFDVLYNLVEIFSIQKEFREILSQMCIGFRVMYPLLFSDFIENWFISTDIEKIFKYFHRNSCSGSRIVSSGQTDGMTWRSKLWLLAISIERLHRCNK